MTDFLSLINSSTPTGIQGVTCIMVEAKTLMHQGCSVHHTTARCLVDRHIPDMLSKWRALTGVELASQRQ